jgi:predicted phosphodiesterase
MNLNNQSPLDDTEVAQFISRLVRAGETNKSIARAVEKGFGIDTSDDSIRRFRSRHDLNIPGTEPAYTKIHNGEAECLTKLEEHGEDEIIVSDPDRMLSDRGLDPVDWYIDSLTANEWYQKGGVNNTKLTQTKFHAKLKTPYVGLMPVRADGQKIPERIKRSSNEPELVVICGDQHAPFYDKHLHACFLQWLEYNEPDRGVVLGDLGDYPDISRHPSDPENLALAQECLQSSGDILRDYVWGSVDTTWEYLIGNHDERLRQYMLKNAPKMFPLSTIDTADSPGEEVHAMSHLLRLDEIGVKLINPHGAYEHAQVELSDKLAVRHGWLVRQGSGATALQTLGQTGYSVIMGHTHRQSVVYKSQPEIDGAQRTTLAVETGCMCRVDKRGAFDEKGRRFPNYGAGHPDWQRGFCVARIYPDGKFDVSLASYINNVLIWEGQRYE